MTVLLGLCTIASAAVLDVAQPPVDTTRATVTAVIAEESERTPFFFGAVTGLAIDGAGRVYVTDGGEARVAVFNSSGAPVTTFGRKGKGPGEFDYPTGPAIARDGALYVRNMSTVARFVVDAKTGVISRFDRVFTGPTYAPWMSKLATVIDREQRLHFPLEWGSQADRLQHNAYKRFSLDGRALDSINVPMQPTARSVTASVMVSANSGRMLKGLNVVPFHPVPVWTVSLKGTIISSPSNSYTLQEIDARGATIRTVTRAVPLVAIPSAERSDSARALGRRIDSLKVPITQVQGMSDEVKSKTLPTTYPVFRSLSTAFDGTIWARRWSGPAQKGQSWFDVLSEDGRILRSVMVPADCATLPTPVIRDGVLACVQLAPDTDAESVVIARIPPPRR